MRVFGLTKGGKIERHLLAKLLLLVRSVRGLALM